MPPHVASCLHDTSKTLLFEAVTFEITSKIM
jgi:hypothetical protein